MPMFQLKKYPIFIFFISFIFLITGAKFIRHPLTSYIDVSLYIQTGQLLLEGKRPYVDFFDIKPPLIMYLNVIPNVIANFFGIHPLIIFTLLTFLLFFWSFSTIKSILLTSRLPISIQEIHALQGMWAFFLAFAYFSSSTFGQREHLFILAFIPYMLLRWVRISDCEVSKIQSIVVGLLVGLFACLKPHYFLLIGVVEIYVFFIISGTVMLSLRPIREDKDPLKDLILEYTKPKDPVLILTSTLSPAYPLLTQIDRRPASRYLGGIIPLLFPGKKASDGSMVFHHSWDESSEDEKKMIGELIEDINTSKPPLIIIGNHRNHEKVMQSHHTALFFEVYNYLDRLGVLQKLTEGYEPIANLKIGESYIVYKRIDQR